LRNLDCHFLDIRASDIHNEESKASSSPYPKEKFEKLFIDTIKTPKNARQINTNFFIENFSLRTINPNNEVIGRAPMRVKSSSEKN